MRRATAFRVGWGWPYMQILSRRVVARSCAMGVYGWLCAAGCGPDEKPPAQQQVVVTEFGGTCGEWQTAKDAQRVSASCGDGMECMGWFASYPDDQVGNHYGRCLPVTAVCNASDRGNPSGACPDKRLTCLVGQSARPPGACFVHCSVPTRLPRPVSGLHFWRLPVSGVWQRLLQPGRPRKTDVCVPD